MKHNLQSNFTMNKELSALFSLDEIRHTYFAPLDSVIRTLGGEAVVQGINGDNVLMFRDEAWGHLTAWIHSSIF